MLMHEELIGSNVQFHLHDAFEIQTKVRRNCPQFGEGHKGDFQDIVPCVRKHHPAFQSHRHLH